MTDIVPKETTVLSSPTIDELLIVCYLTLEILEYEDQERELTTEVIEELMRRLEDQNK